MAAAASNVGSVCARPSRRTATAELEWQLEDRAFKELMPRHYREVARLVREKRAERERYTARCAALLERALMDAGLAGTVHGRTKHLYSIHRKLLRYAACGRGFDEIYDLTALRVVLGSVADCYSALGVVHAMWRPLPGEFDDYIADPKQNLYQSLHSSVIGPEGRPLEVQIRTAEMHRIAEHGAAAHASYKRAERPIWRSGAEKEKEAFRGAD
jgi:(p)ppGpp synthase/HD superfamily hydrolase